MKANLYNQNGQAIDRQIELPEEFFGVTPNEHAVYLAVKLYLANQRQGTSKAKERSENAHSTRKLKKQKGTGGARAGDIKSPVFVGGGTIFGPKPRDYNFKLNKKVKHLARVSSLSAKANEGNILVVEDINYDAPKTKNFVSLLNNLDAKDKRVLMVTSNDINKNVWLSGRNIPRTKIVTLSDLSTYDIVNAHKVIFSESCINLLKDND